MLQLRNESDEHTDCLETLIKSFLERTECARRWKVPSIPALRPCTLPSVGESGAAVAAVAAATLTLPKTGETFKGGAESPWESGLLLLEDSHPSRGLRRGSGAAEKQAWRVEN